MSERPNILDKGTVRPMTDAECQCYQTDAQDTPTDNQSTEEVNRQLISQISTDFVSFMDYFFSEFPE